VPETVLACLPQDTEYGAAKAFRRRWVARAGQAYPVTSYNFIVQVAYSDTPHVWHAVRSLGTNEDHCAIAPLDDHSAMLVYAGQSGLVWAKLTDTTWVAQGVLDGRPWTATHPRFRRRPSGGWWLMWQESAWMHMSYYDQGQWFTGEQVKAAHPTGDTFVASWGEMSRDAAERPVLFWCDLGAFTTFRDVLSISYPSANGWNAGEEVPGTADFLPNIAVARDRDDDVWIAWQLRSVGRVLWSHTYTRSTASRPDVMSSGPRRIVTWELSEAAPGSWWTVWRSRAGDPFAQVARVRADTSRRVSWADGSAPGGILRYKVRRETAKRRST
jgi:hypothetical protein